MLSVPACLADRGAAHAGHRVDVGLLLDEVLDDVKCADGARIVERRARLQLLVLNVQLALVNEKLDEVQVASLNGVEERGLTKHLGDVDLDQGLLHQPAQHVVVFHLDSDMNGGLFIVGRILRADRVRPLLEDLLHALLVFSTRRIDEDRRLVELDERVIDRLFL